MVNLVPTCRSSFFSCEKDLETILKKLFVQGGCHSEELKRLLVIANKDCLDNRTNQKYNEIIKGMGLKQLREKGYIKFEPKIRMPEHEEMKAYIIVTFDNFVTNATNPEFRDCVITFDVLCHLDCWDIGDYRIRPLKICGYIDGLLNNSRLSGIGTFQFVSCNELILSPQIGGYSLTYTAVHGSDDMLPPAP